MTAQKRTEKADIWFVYDGDCPICNVAARGLRIRRDVGALHLVNAREDKDHVVYREVCERGYNLDDGMVIKYADAYYHGDDALHLMALLGSSQGWFNRMNALLFRSRRVAKFCYPSMRAVRNMLLRIKNVHKINNLLDVDAPLFKTVLGEDWNALPPVLKKHYDVRPFSDDIVTVKGTLDVKVSTPVSLMARITGMLIPYSAVNVPVTVTFHAHKTKPAFCFNRVFHYPKHGDKTFYSEMEWIGGNQLVEFMKFGVGWKLAYFWRDNKIILEHRGYVWRLFGVTIPLPLHVIMGKGYAEEMAVDETHFSMWTYAHHRTFGAMFKYAGTFEVLE